MHKYTMIKVWLTSVSSAPHLHMYTCKHTNMHKCTMIKVWLTSVSSAPHLHMYTCKHTNMHKYNMIKVWLTSVSSAPHIHMHTCKHTNMHKYTMIKVWLTSVSPEGVARFWEEGSASFWGWVGFFSAAACNHGNYSDSVRHRWITNTPICNLNPSACAE